MKIKTVIGREIIDSRGNPTAEAEVILEDGSRGRGSAPSGASTGIAEAHELRDKEDKRFLGNGVRKAVCNINTEIRERLTGMNFCCFCEVDDALIRLDGSRNKSNLGANAVLAVSIAAAKASAKSAGMPLYRYIGGVSAVKTPVPMMNILNGGAHAGNNIDVQEFMIMPVGAKCFADGLMWCCEVYHTLKGILKSKGLSASVGDEGGFAPDLCGDREALELLLEAVEKAGYRAGQDFVLALDAASSEWKSGSTGKYHLPKSGREYTSSELVSYWESLVREYPIMSLEDGADEEDTEGWKLLTDKLGKCIQLVGDDLFVTNPERLMDGIREKTANAILVKPNQIGTLSEAMQAVRIAQNAGFGTVMSHRSGETEDTTIADLAVGLGTGQIKTGAPCRGERTAKYNRLLRIAGALGGAECYPGRCCFPVRGGCK